MRFVPSASGLRRWLVRAVVAAVVVLGVGALGSLWFVERELERQRQASWDGELDAGWMERFRGAVRAREVPPDLGGPRTEGDGAALLYERALGWDRPFGYRWSTESDTILARARRVDVPTPADSAIWRAVVPALEVGVGDRLDALHQAAHHSDWRATDWIVARGDSLQESPFWMESASWEIRRAGDILLLRARVRAMDGRNRDAVDDATAVGLVGVRMMERDPTLSGFFIGRFMAQAAAEQLRRLEGEAPGTGAGSLAAAIDASTLDTSDLGSFWLAFHPDSALMLARDSSLAFPFRGMALQGFALGESLLSPRALVFGPPAEARVVLRWISETDPDPDVRTLAAVFGRSLDRVDRLSPLERLRLVLR